MAEECPICREELSQPSNTSGVVDGMFYICPRCGRFTLSGSLASSLPHMLTRDNDASAKLSYFVRRSQHQSRAVMLDTYTVDAVLKQPLPRPREQADLLIRWLGENVPGPGETVWIEPRTHGAIIGSKSPRGFKLVLDYLFRSGLVIGNSSEALGQPGQAHATLSFDGWEAYERLRQGSVFYRKAFMAMQFNDTALEKILEDVFKPSAKQAGFELLKLDDAPRAGLIDDRLRVEIQSADFVLADLTHDNHGAYWEAGYAEGLGKPVIYLCEKNKFYKKKTHFDTNHHLTIIWDADSPNDAGIALKATIRATLPHLAIQQDEKP